MIKFWDCVHLRKNYSMNLSFWIDYSYSIIYICLLIYTVRASYEENTKRSCQLSPGYTNEVNEKLVSGETFIRLRHAAFLSFTLRLHKCRPNWIKLFKCCSGSILPFPTECFLSPSHHIICPNYYPRTVGHVTFLSNLITIEWNNKHHSVILWAQRWGQRF